jgi:hypothetical protein
MKQSDKEDSSFCTLPIFLIFLSIIVNLNNNAAFIFRNSIRVEGNKKEQLNNLDY